MSARKSFFFRQRVTEEELNAAFDDLEDADHNLAGDLGFTGVLANAAVSPHAPVPDLTVDVSGPASILDQLGRRVFFSGLQNVGVAQDGNGVATAVSAADKEKVVSVFVAFDRAVSDARIDGNSATVFFRNDESFQFVVVQGGEATAGKAEPPQLRSDAILLADVTRRFGQVQILGEDISTARRQDALVVTGVPRSIRRGRTIEAIADLLALHNVHVTGAADRHPAASIDFAGGGAWADGTTNPATTVEAQLDKLVADLAAAGGGSKVGAAATAAAPNALAAGSVKSQLDALLASVNAHVTNASGAHAASAIAYAGGGVWKDGAANPATTVEAQLDKLVADLTADLGAARIGTGARTNWLDGRANPAGVSLLAALNKIIADLSEQTASADGAVRIGAQTSGNLPAGSLRSQLDALDATSVRTTVANVFSATQTINGGSGDASAALATTLAPGVRKLLWEIAGTADNYKFRLYATSRTLEFTLNARWDRVEWVKDIAAQASTKFEINNNEFTFNADAELVSPFADTWDNSIHFGITNHGAQELDAGGNWISAGATETYAAWSGPSGNATRVGVGVAYRKMYPVFSGSITFSPIGIMRNVAGALFAISATTSGTTVVATVAAANTETFFAARVFSS
jgi:hypothetical protein